MPSRHGLNRIEHLAGNSAFAPENVPLVTFVLRGPRDQVQTAFPQSDFRRIRWRGNAARRRSRSNAGWCRGQLVGPGCFGGQVFSLERSAARAEHRVSFVQRAAMGHFFCPRASGEGLRAGRVLAAGETASSSRMGWPHFRQKDSLAGFSYPQRHRLIRLLMLIPKRRWLLSGRLVGYRVADKVHRCQAATQRAGKVLLWNARHEHIGAIKEEIQMPRAFPAAAVYVGGVA